jgi:hypothetical protein
MVAPSRPVANGHTDAATPGDTERLFDRKLALVRDALSCRSLFAELEAVDGELDRLGAEKAEIEDRLRALKAEADEAETLAVVAVEGRNEAERKARRAEALRDDPRHREAAARLRDAAGDAARVEADLERMARRRRRVERAIDYRIAALRFLGD